MSEDHLIKLAFSMQSQKGVYALLLGSGVSVSAGIPTGWGVVCDLICKLAELHGEQPGEEPWIWYEQKFGKQADYSELLDSLARTPSERSKILTSYFEPDERERSQGKKLPTPAHESIARLISHGFIKIIITTNFDRLMEKALSDLNINPIIVSSAHDIKGLPSLVHMDSPLIIKVNGDYLDTRIKNTPEELATYEPEMNELLKRIFSEYGLIISGWSGKYDNALKNCYNSSINKEFSTFWVDPTNLADEAEKLLTIRDGTYVKATSDEFFTDLAEKLKVDGKDTTQSATQINQVEAPNNLPDGLSTFVGREEEISEITAILKEDRLITLLGTGGSGKTRLGIEIAREHLEHFNFGVWFVDLSRITDSNQVPQAVAGVLGVKEEPDKPLVETLKNKLGSGRVLLVFDNCEQIATGIAELAEKLLSSSPGLKIITTSREALGIPCEKLWFIPEMKLPNYKPTSKSVHPKSHPLTSNKSKTQNKPSSPPVTSIFSLSDLLKYSAIKLFVERAQAVSSDFKLTIGNAEAVVSICKKLDGLPLAIELAAARIKVLSASQILDKLNKRFKLLTKGAKSATDRQKTLRGAIDWSYDLLSDDEKTLFARLSVFVGGFTLESATGVTTGNFEFEVNDKELKKLYLEQKERTILDDPFSDFDEFEILDLIDQLVSKSLLISKKTSHGDTRFHFLQSIREYALQKLEESDELTFTQTRYLEWFVVWVNSNSKNLRAAEQALWFSRFESEHDNIVNALEHSKKTGRDLLFIFQATFTCIFWNIMGFLKLGYKWTNSALTIDCKRTKTTASLHMNCGVFAHWLQNIDEAIKVTRISLDIYKELGLEKQTSAALQNLGIYLQDKGEVETSIELYKQAEKICISNNETGGLAYIQMNLGLTYSSLSQYDKALEYLEKALKLFDSLSDYRAICWTLRSISKIHIRRLELKKAEKYLKDSLEASRKANVHFEEIQTLQRLGNLYTVTGRYQKALDTYEHIRKLSQNQLQDVGTGYYRTCTIEAYLFMGDFEKAKFYSEKAGLFDKSKTLNSYSTNKLMAMILFYLFSEDTKNADEINEILDDRFDSITSYSKKARYLLYKGFLEYQKGNLDESEKCLKISLASFYKSNSMLRVVDCLEFFAKIRTKQQKLKEASVLLGKADRLREKYGAPIPPVMKRHMDELNKILKGFFGRAFETFKEKGASMTTEEVVMLIHKE